MAQEAGRPFIFLDLCTQQDFFGPAAVLNLFNVAPVRKKLLLLMKCAADARVPMVAGCDAHSAGDPEFQRHALPAHALADTPGARKLAATWVRGAQVIPASGKRRPWPDLKPIAERGGQIILEKREFDLFTNPACREVLGTFSPRELILWGGMLEHDVLTTAVSAHIQGYDVTVIEDACARRHAGAAVRARGRLFARGVRFVKTEEVLLRIGQWWKQEQSRMRRQRAL